MTKVEEDRKRKKKRFRSKKKLKTCSILPGAHKRTRHAKELKLVHDSLHFTSCCCLSSFPFSPTRKGLRGRDTYKDFDLSPLAYDGRFVSGLKQPGERKKKETVEEEADNEGRAAKPNNNFIFFMLSALHFTIRSNKK